MRVASPALLGRACAVMAWSCAAAPSCSESDSEGASQVRTDTQTGSNRDSPQFVISTRIYGESNNSETAYLTTVGSLEAGTTYNLDNAVEIVGGGYVFGNEGESSFYFASATEPLITRWEVSPDGKFTKGPSVSFANLGLSSALSAADSPLYSPNKSYITDRVQANVIVWDPSKMELIDTIALDRDSDQTLSPTVFTGLTAREDRIYATMYWSEKSDWTRLGTQSRLFAIDTGEDQVVSTTDDTRCNQVTYGGKTSDGTTYLTSRSYFTLPHLVFGDGFGAGSCALRVAPDADDFDADYAIDLGELVGGRPAGDLTLVSDDLAYIRVWHEERVNSESTADNWDTIAEEPGFHWWKWQLGASAAEEIPDQEGSANPVQLRRVDGKVYALRYAPSFASTELQELGRDGQLKQGLSGPGGIYGLIRVR